MLLAVGRMLVPALPDHAVAQYAASVALLLGLSWLSNSQCNLQYIL